MNNEDAKNETTEETDILEGEVTNHVFGRMNFDIVGGATMFLLGFYVGKRKFSKTLRVIVETKLPKGS